MHDEKGKMDSTSKVRTVTRRHFTRTANTFDSILESAETDTTKKLEAQACYNVVKDIYTKLSELDEEIRENITSSDTWDENVLEKELEDEAKYKAGWLLLDTKFRALMIKTEQSHHQPAVNDRKIKLPSLEISKFDGNIKNWLTFWGQFRKIDTDPAIDDIDKLQYLRQSMAPDSEVKAFVESFPLTKETYELCISELKSRFAREDMLVQVYVRELLALILNRHNNMDLTTLYDNINSHLRSLEVLKVTKEKYAAFLLPMVESALPSDILKIWERSRPAGVQDELTSLIDFLKKEVESIQRVALANNFKVKDSRSQEPTATCLAVNSTTMNKEIKCIWCEKPHSSSECFKIAKMSLEERREYLKKKKACALCLRPGHHAKVCKLFIKCYVCQQRHSPVLCSAGTAPKTVEVKTSIENISSTVSGTTLLQTATIQICSGDKTFVTRALFDNGSQRSYIKQEIIDQLGIPSIKSEKLTHHLFGGVEIDSKNHNIYNVNIKSVNNSFSMNIMALSQNCICKNVPMINYDSQLNQMLKDNHILLTESEKTNSEIGLLIGADFMGYLLTGTIIQLGNGLVAIDTRIGWTLQGTQVGKTLNNLSTTTLFCSNQNDLSGYWSLELLGIRDPLDVKNKSEREEEAVAAFEKTVRVNENHRYEVQLPYKVGCAKDILPNYDLAKQRLESTTKKLLSSNTFDTYHDIIKDWCDIGIIEVVEQPDINKNKSHYLPHRPVIKNSSLTTKVRPVFDASAKDRKGKSLNSCLDKGINFIEKIPKLLIGFRKGAIGVTADISKAFLQIAVSPEDRDQLRFLWWKDNNRTEMVTYRHCRVVFGLTCSPFLLAATMNYHLKQKCSKNYSETAELLNKTFYVDNCVISFDSEYDVQKFMNESKLIMENAQFDLRQWVISPMGINDTNQTEISVLGILWDTLTDSLQCNTKSLPCPEHIKKVTKRNLLSIVQRVFDPIGYTGPVMLPAKVIVQETWNRELSWDEELPPDLLSRFIDWYKDINCLNDCKIPRRLTHNNLKDCKVSLHMFCDASKHGYGACVLLRAESNDKVSVQMVLAKSKITPPKKATIPRLELLAALIGSRLLASTRQDLELSQCPEYLWTDSSVALTWIKRELEWNNFIGNRVKEIREHTDINNWFHIPGQYNWADVASRGCTAKALLNCRWWEGPEWLLQPPEQWPKSELQEVDEADLELKKTVCNTHLCSHDAILDKLSIYFSKYTKIVRTIAWVYRFVHNTQHKNIKNSSELTYKEYEKAEYKILKMIQESEREELLKKGKSLTQIIGKDMIIRIKTKLLLSEMPETIRTPILLPARNDIVIKMVQQRHTQLQHAGANHLIADIRSRFWIIGVRRLVKSVINKCVICNRYRSKPVPAPTAPLPTERLESAAPFQTTGVDLAGPLYLRGGDKCWVVLFTCAVYRAVHLEVTRSLSTEAFMMTLRRFIARRGRASLIVSDCGTNFQGMKNLLTLLNWDEIQRESTIRRIEWKLNVPTACWWGGFWERLIRLMKDLLKRILGKSAVTYDELQTVLCDCEAIMNARPLTYVNDDRAESLEPLTPAYFIQPLPNSEVTDLDHIDHNSLSARMKFLQEIRNQFRQRFKSEYLTLLVQKGKEERGQLNRGDVVLIDTNEKRIKWPLGVVEEIYSGKDGENRTARVRTQQGFKIRPFQRLYRLEVTSNSFLPPVEVVSGCPEEKPDEDPITNSNDQYTTRHGRKINLPSKYDLYIT